MDTGARKPYLTDLTDDEWAILEPLLLRYEDRVRPVESVPWICEKS